ncbi:hypothetical protein [Bacillus phage vB_BanS-Thrax5]|nr:hypothetical protein [Bacillus phage vB_BanS-Thrax5]
MLNAIAVFKDNNDKIKELKLNWKTINDVEVTKVSFTSLGGSVLYTFKQTVGNNGSEVELIINTDKMTELKLL